MLNRQTRDRYPCRHSQDGRNEVHIAGLAIAWIVALGIVGIGLAYTAGSERMRPASACHGSWNTTCVAGGKSKESATWFSRRAYHGRDPRWGSRTLVVDPGALADPAWRRHCRPNKWRSEERGVRHSWSNRGGHDTRCGTLSGARLRSHEPCNCERTSVSMTPDAGSVKQ